MEGIKIDNKDILSVPTCRSIENLFFMYFYNLNHQLISSPFLVRYEPYDFQNYILLKALRNKNIKLFLADEVGLGKTIEALLIIQELILKRNYNRIIIILPKSLIKQWEEEIVNWTYIKEQMKIHYIFDSRDLREAFTKDEKNKLIICSEKLFIYNNNYSNNMLDWDLLVVDEVHHARSYEYYSVQEDRVREKRNELYRGLISIGKRTKSFIFLSATPIQLDIKEFKKLVEINYKELFHEFDFTLYKDYHAFIKGLFFLLDEFKKEEFKIDRLIIFRKINEYIQSDENSKFWSLLNNKYLFTVSDQIRDYDHLQESLSRIEQALIKEHLYCKILIRNRKRDIFKKLKVRNINDCPVEMHETYANVDKKIKELVKTFESYFSNPTEYSEGFTRGKAITGYLISSYREYMSSSRAQIKQSLLNRFNNKVEKEGSVYKLSSEAIKIQRYIKELVTLKEEHDNKANKLIEVIEECKHIKHIIVFANFYATIDYLSAKLEGLRKEIHILTGRDTDTQKKRKVVINEFNERGGILLSSNIGGEGLNLQYSNVLINYDLHWNPTKLEQRIGRIDRIGQKERVIIYNIYYSDSLAGIIYTRLKRRLEYQTHGIGEIEPILEEISKMIRTKEESKVETLTEKELISAESDINSKMRNLKEDLILKKESFDIDYFNQLKKYLPKLNYLMVLNYMNCILYGYDITNQVFRNYDDDKYFYLKRFVFNLNRDSVHWSKIMSSSLSFYWKNALKMKKIDEIKSFISIPKFKKLSNYQHGIGDPGLNLLIHYFGKKAYNNKKIFFSKVNSSKLIDGYIFLYRFRFTCGFFRHNIIFPIFFNMDGVYSDKISQNILKQILTDGTLTLIEREEIVSEIDFQTIKNLQYHETCEIEYEQFIDTMLKEINYIIEQRKFKTNSNRNFEINKRKLERNSNITKRDKFNIKLEKSKLSKENQKQYRYANTRINTLSKEIKDFEEKMETELANLKTFSEFSSDKELFIILKIEGRDEEDSSLFNISENFSDRKEVYLIEDFTFKITSGPALIDLLRNYNHRRLEEIKFIIKLNNVVINSELKIDGKVWRNLILFKNIEKFNEIKINFKLSGIISDIVQISLYLFTKSTLLLLYSKDIKVHLYKIFMYEKEGDIERDLTEIETEIIELNQEYDFLIRTHKELENIDICTKDQNEIDEVIRTLPVTLLEEKEGLKDYVFSYRFSKYGKFFFKLGGIKSDFMLIIIPSLEFQFPDIKNTNKFIVEDFDFVKLIIKGDIMNLLTLLQKNLRFLLKKRNFTKIFSISLEEIFFDERYKDSFETFIEANRICLPFSALIPEDILKLRLGEYILDIMIFDITLDTFSFKLFPEIYTSYYQDYEIFDDNVDLKIKVHISDPEHVRYSTFLDFKFPEMNYKYLQSNRIKCDSTVLDAFNKNGDLVYITPPLKSMLSGEAYSINIETDYEIHPGNSFKGPRLKLSDLGINKVYGYDGLFSKSLLIQNIGFNSLCINGKEFPLFKGLNSIDDVDLSNIEIKFNNNLSIKYSHQKSNRDHIDEISNHLRENGNNLPVKVKDFFVKELKYNSNGIVYPLLFHSREHISFQDLLVKSKSIFNNVYVVYPTEALFQNEISKFISYILNEDRDINVNLITFPSPSKKHVHEDKYDELFQSRKIFPIILEKCLICGSAKKFNESTKDLYCKCTDEEIYDNLPYTHLVSSKIIIKCENCNSRMLLLIYREKRNKVILSCMNCNNSLSNVNTFFKKFEFSQINSVNFMTIEQFEYSTKKGYIENDNINKIQLELLHELLRKEEEVKNLWKDSYPRKLYKIKEEMIFFRNYIFKPNKTKEKKIKTTSSKIPQKKPLQQSRNNFFHKFRILGGKLSHKIKKLFSRSIKSKGETTKEKPITIPYESQIQEEESISFKNITEIKHHLKNLKDVYNQIYDEWKNEISNYIEFNLLKDSNGFSEVEEDSINDMISIDEFDLLSELDEIGNEDKTTHYFLHNSIKFLKGLGIFDDYLDLTENFPGIISKFLKKSEEHAGNNLFIFMDLNAVPDHGNQFIKSFSYLKEQLIIFNNEFCGSSNRHYGLLLY